MPKLKLMFGLHSLTVSNMFEVRTKLVNQLGHKDFSTMQVYADLGDEKIAKEILWIEKQPEYIKAVEMRDMTKNMLSHYTQ